MSLKRHILRHITVQEQIASDSTQVETTTEVVQPAETSAASHEEAPEISEDVKTVVPEVEAPKKPTFQSKKKKTTTKSS